MAEATATTRMIEAAMTNAPQPRWHNYAVTYGRKTELWVTPERAAEIEASCETRIVAGPGGRYHQWLDTSKLLGNRPQTESAALNKENPELAARG